jgi:hypothetical protein
MVQPCSEAMANKDTLHTSRGAHVCNLTCHDDTPQNALREEEDSKEAAVQLTDGAEEEWWAGSRTRGPKAVSVVRRDVV